MTSQYTDIVARFTDEVAAETLANYIASHGISCDLVDLFGTVHLDRYAIRVQRDQIATLRQALDLKAVSTALNFNAAQIIAGRLAREDVPCYIGGWHIPGPFGSPDVPINETKVSGSAGTGLVVSVPAKFVDTALRILNEAPVSEAELTKLALAADPDQNEPL